MPGRSNVLRRPWAIVSGFERRLRRIEKNEAKALKVLSKTRKELIDALHITDKLIEENRQRAKPNELRLQGKLELLRKQVESVESELAELRLERENGVRPLMERRADLESRLAAIDLQLESANKLKKDEHMACSMRHLGRSQTTDNASEVADALHQTQSGPSKPLRRRSASAMPLAPASSPPAYSP